MITLSKEGCDMVVGLIGHLPIGTKLSIDERDGTLHEFFKFNENMITGKTTSYRNEVIAHFTIGINPLSGEF